MKQAELPPTSEPPVDRGFALRRLVRGANRAALGTLLEGPGGPAPYVSLVSVATDLDGTPLLLLSQLSDHTRNLARDARLSLLFDGTEGYPNPQQGPRVTLIGRAVQSPEEGVRRRYLARNPGAALYAGFADFAFYRAEIERAHWVGGFGKAAWVSRGLTCPPEAVENFRASGDAGLAEANRVLAGALDRIAHRLLKRRGAGWSVAGLDPDGCDLARATTVVRLSFESFQITLDKALRHLAELAEKAASMA